MNVVTKGKEGEREVCTLLRLWATEVLKEKFVNLTDEYIEKIVSCIQRNQNQSAVGGADINCFGLSIEVKRQEQLAIDQWWAQAVASAQRADSKPILIYRQNGKRSWHVVMLVAIENCDGTWIYARGQISQPVFQLWFKERVEYKVRKGELSRV